MVISARALSTARLRSSVAIWVVYFGGLLKASQTLAKAKVELALGCTKGVMSRPHTNWNYCDIPRFRWQTEILLCIPRRCVVSEIHSDGKVLDILGGQLATV